MASKKILIAMPEGLMTAIDQLAKIEHRTRSELIREALRKYLTAAKRRPDDASN